MKSNSAAISFFVFCRLSLLLLLEEDESLMTAASQTIFSYSFSLVPGEYKTFDRSEFV